MVSIGLEDAFFAAQVHAGDKKCIKFDFDNLFQFFCIANGHGPAWRVCTKMSKVY